MVRKKFFSGDNRFTSASVAPSTSSGVGASITATIVSNCGKAFSNTISRCRAGLLDERSWLISVVMAKCVMEYHADRIARMIVPAITGQE